MRLGYSKSKNTVQFYVMKDIKKNGKRSTKIVKKLGNYEQIQKKANGEDPYIWAKNYIEKLNKKAKEGSEEILIKKSQTKKIEKGKNNLYNCGYLFLEKIYYQLKLDKICKEISERHQFKYDLSNILSRLIYGRVIFPSSKLATNESSKKFIEQPNFKLEQIYRALEVINEENDFIQSQLYKNSEKIHKRNTGVLYYDCTNYFFEIEQADGIKQYGPSKEHRPNPIVQMGLFMDGDGMPLAFNITSGNTNEQTTMTPLEEKIMKDFEISKFIVCTDAGLSSNENRKFNDKEERAFITTQSIKKLKKHLREWALSKEDWSLVGNNKKYNLNEILKTEESQKYYYDKIFYKERWIKENGLEQKLVVTYSLKYKNYQENIRNNQIERAKKAIENGCKKIDSVNQNDYKRLITKTSITEDGEVAEKKVYTINENQIAKEEQYDGFYGVCTNLDESATEIVKVNKRRWEIEECFRIMKTEFKARPVYLSREDRIKAHFMICYIALLVYRILEKKLGEKFTTKDIIETLRNMYMYKEETEGYFPAYVRTDLTDKLHEKSGFRTDYEIITEQKMKKILKSIKK